MNPNHSMSFDDKNQFMPASHAQKPVAPDPMFDNFVQACFSNPAFFQSMKSFYYNQGQQPNPQVGVSQTHGYQNQQSYSRQRDVEQTQIQNQKIFQQKEETISAPKKKLPANPLLKYQQKQTVQKNPPKQQKAIPVVRAQNYEDIPIKSKYIEEVGTFGESSKVSLNLDAIKENQSINIETAQIYRQMEDRPIKGMNQHQYHSHFGQTQHASSQPTLQPTKKTPRFQQDRPIQGSTKDFKEMLKDKCPDIQIASNQDYQGYQQPQESSHFGSKKGSHTFLKRGSRQHLSSAITRGKQQNKNDQDELNKSGLSKRDLTPKNSRSSISQNNRVLTKKSNNLDRSMDKSQNVREEISKIGKPPLAAKKIDPKPSKQAQKNSPISKKKKTKNVFNDQSSSSSSSSEQEPVAIQKALVHSKQTKTIEQIHRKQQPQCMQVIEGVFLTQQQLQEILDRYGKKTARQETQSEKIAKLRNKYTQLCNLVEEEKAEMKSQMERQRQEMQKWKADQMAKMKNQKRVWERQMKSGAGSTAMQKEKQQIQQVKQQLQKQREDFKKKDKNNRIMIEKYKKQIEQLKSRLQRIQIDREISTSKIHYQNYSSDLADDKYSNKDISRHTSNDNSRKKLDQEPKKEEVPKIQKKQVSEKPPMKKKGPQNKIKYDYVEDQDTSKLQQTKTKGNSIKSIADKWGCKYDSSDSDAQSAAKQSIQQKSMGPQWSPAMKLSDLTKIDLSISMVSDKMIESLFRYQNNLEYRAYQQSKSKAGRVVVNTTRNNRNNFTTNIYSDGAKEMIYDNGTVKDSQENGYNVVYFKNGDIKQTLPDKTILYYFKEKEVDQITLTNGINIYRFENNQVEFHYTNGTIEIRHPDGTTKVIGQQLKR